MQVPEMVGWNQTLNKKCGVKAACMLGVLACVVILYPPSYPLLKFLLQSCQSLDDGLRVALNHVEQHQRRTVRGAVPTFPVT